MWSDETDHTHICQKQVEKHKFPDGSSTLHECYCKVTWICGSVEDE